MRIEKPEICVVWLKRDLRLHDNEAVFNAIKSGKRVLLLYVFEPLLINDPHYSERHWNFIKESLRDMNQRLETFSSKILAVKSDLSSAFNHIQSLYRIDTVFSHQETGIMITYERDKSFKRYTRNNTFKWIETINNGVKRGLRNREYWFEGWNAYMSSPILTFNPNPEQLLNGEEVEALEQLFNVVSLETPTDGPFQKGGTTRARETADSFFDYRHKSYMFNISKPEASRKTNSRLSPYLAWGNISVREIFQEAKRIKSRQVNKRHIGAFISRLRWQAHFIQKFEMEHIMEEASVNKGYHRLKKKVSEEYQRAWKEGQTGFPLVDASMRCLNTTGYVNFRMRALLVSFFTHILWQPWQEATTHLSQQFLDFEPGIHFPQLQMQAGETGINNLRIYNPIKNSKEHDPEAEFIKKWVPELAHLDLPFIHEPFLMTPLEEQLYNFKIGRDYPKPIVDIEKNRRRAAAILFKMKDDPKVMKESRRILDKHTLANRKRMLRDE
ncbi:MAG: deoxyribodipyrimidine photo-lyase [Bacteroidia bacterium]|nr:deoxyribodipyrimidine photo-lyase [Bacteroidia bacterium]MBT8267815.1 deoxyribodipyrimidine photo-lyase [Bacteroidia bacterium]